MTPKPFFRLARGAGRAMLATSLLSLSFLAPMCAAASESESAASAAVPGAPRERTLLTADWRFHRGDAPDAAAGTFDYAVLRPWLLATGTDLVNAGVRKTPRPEGNPGGDVSFVQSSFNDAAWRKLDLPHDWAIEGPFQQDLPGETGKLPWQGVGWYRKTFSSPASDAGRRVYVEFDGAMSYSAVWLNGKFVGGWPYGYSTFRLDLTPYLKVGGENVLAVRLDNPPDSSRWYPGSGIYRHVWLVKTAPVALTQWGVFVSTPRISAESALINVDATVENLSGAKTHVALTARFYELDAAGQRTGAVLGGSERFDIELDPAKATQGMRSLVGSITKPKLWDLESPHRYVAVTTVEVGGKVVDELETPFGIRTAGFVADDGFHLNGRRVPLNGVCQHHDQGALGTAINVDALARQLRILREMGVNAIRTSHNPPAPELLELCDRLGFLVMDEPFDCWRRGKKWPADVNEFSPEVRYFDYAKVFDDWHERDLRAMIRRDRNHPSVVIWSIGNEIIEQWVSDGWQLAAHLGGIIREEDRTRPLTGGFNGEISGYSGFQTVVDAVGYNYKPWEYAPFKRRNPHRAVYGSETASTLSTRGEYFFPLEPANKQHGRVNFQVSSYDLSAADWAMPPDVEWKALDENPFTAGEFVWTGFDYLGEPTPYNADATNLLNFSDPAERARVAADLERLGKIPVPSRSSYFGIIDLAGFPKDRFFLYQARWRPELKMAHLLPHWTWPERVGQVTPVQVYSSGDEAELFLNGKSLGRKKRGKFEYRFRWDDVVYVPGEIKVVTWKNGQPWAEAVQRTAGTAAKLVLGSDRAKFASGGGNGSAGSSPLAFLTATVVDANGVMVPRAKTKLKFSVSGPAEIVATDNGDPTSFESFQSPERSAFNGLALVVVKAKRGAAGKVIVRVEGEGLVASEVTLSAE